LQSPGIRVGWIVASKKNIETLYDLKAWDVFENANQNIFAGMYQFWCQKKVY